MQNTKMQKFVAGVAIGGMLLGLGATSAFAKNVSSKAVVKKTNIAAAKGNSNWDGHLKREKVDYLKGIFDNAVKAGTITQAEEDKITAYVKDQQAQRKAEMDKIKNMTPDQRKAYFASKTNNRQDIFTGMVSAKIITQAQADAIKKTIPAKTGLEGRKFGKRSEDPTALVNNFKTKLDAVVKAGTITQDQEDKIIAAVKKQQDDRKAEMDKIKNMTPAERKTYFQNNAGAAKTHVDILTSLVNSGVITQAQANAIKSQFPAGPHGHGGKMLKNTTGNI